MTYLSSFDQIRIIPQVTRVVSRKQCNTKNKLGNLEFDVPILGASMHSLVNQKFLKDIEDNGGGVILPREMSYIHSGKPMLSCSLDTAMKYAEYLVKNYLNPILSIEIANAYQYRMADTIGEVKSKYPDLFILAGTVADYDGCKYLQDSGADGILLGIGCGEVCLTTTNTGVGLPAIASIMDCVGKDIDIPIILSGGVRTYGDFCKAIALGVDFVMTGSLFKACSNSASEGGYWGESSYKQKENVNYIEGKEIIVKTNDKTSGQVVLEAKQALQSAMSYSDSLDLKEFRTKVKIGRLE